MVAGSDGQRRLTWLTYAALLIVGVNNGWLGPFLPQIARQRGIALERAGLLPSALYVGFLLAVLVAGRLVARWSGRRTTIVALGLLGAGLVGLALAPGFLTLLVCAVVVGLGHGLLDVAGHVVMATVHRDDPGRMTAAMNYLNVSFGVGAFLGPLIAGVALRGDVSYGVAFAVGAVVAALVAALLALTPPPAREHVEPTTGVAGILTSPLIWGLGAVLLLYIGAEVGLAAWFATYLGIAGGLDEATAAWIVALFWVGLIAGRTASAWLVGRIAALPLTVGAAILALAGLAVLALVPGGGPAAGIARAAAVAVVGLGFGPVFPNAIAIGALLFPRQVGQMTAAVIAIGSVGGVIGPWALGRTLVLAGPRPAMGLACGAVALLVVCLWSVGRASGDHHEARTTRPRVGADIP